MSKLRELFKIELYCREHELNDRQQEYFGSKLKSLRAELAKMGISEYDYSPEEVMEIVNEKFY